MDSLTIAELQAIVDRDAHTRALRYARTQRWREAHPEEYRAKSSEYMRKYNERKKAEKAEKAALAEKTASPENPKTPEPPKKTRISAKMRLAMVKAALISV